MILKSILLYIIWLMTKNSDLERTGRKIGSSLLQTRKFKLNHQVFRKSFRGSIRIMPLLHQYEYDINLLSHFLVLSDISSVLFLLSCQLLLFLFFYFVLYNFPLFDPNSSSIIKLRSQPQIFLLCKYCNERSELN